MNGWIEKKLGEVCTLQRGFDLPTRDRKEGDYPLISSSGCTDNQAEAKVSAPGVVTGRSGSIGAVFFIDKDFWPLNTTLYVKDFHGNDPRFVFHLLNKFDLKRFSSGSGVPTLNRNSVHDELVYITSEISEQKRIVSIVDEAFEAIDIAIDNTKQNLTNARELFDSYLNAIFTQKGNVWKWVSLSEITTDITDGDHQPPPKSESGIPFITISNINKQDRTVDFSNTFKVSSEYFDKLKHNKKPRQGDILYTVTGSYGIPVVVDHALDFCFQRHIGLIRPNLLETNSKCLYYMLLSRHLLNQADECATGTAQKTVSLSGLRRFSVPKIPKEQQETIVAELDILSDKIYRLEAIYRQKLAALNELKQSILHKAFTGELTADKADLMTNIKQEAIAV